MSGKGGSQKIAFEAVGRLILAMPSSLCLSASHELGLEQSGSAITFGNYAWRGNIQSVYGSSSEHVIVVPVPAALSQCLHTI